MDDGSDRCAPAALQWREKEWLTVREFALFAGLKSRAARAAVAQRMWRTVPLEVRIVRGRGGRAGERYEVSVKSILEPQLNDPAITLADRVKAGFTLRGDSLKAWCRRNSFDPGYVSRVLSGLRDGPAARELRHRLIEASQA
jgi:hypothetical protein